MEAFRNIMLLFYRACFTRGFKVVQPFNSNFTELKPFMPLKCVTCGVYCHNKEAIQRAKIWNVSYHFCSPECWDNWLTF